jgi:hypothetical protein
MNRPESVRAVPYTWVQWINVLLGLAIIVTPFVAQADGRVTASGVISGIVIVIVGLISFFASKDDNGTNISFVNILAGIWLLISTSFTHDTLLVWQNFVYGVLVIVTAIVVMGLHSLHMGLTRTGSH